jgi:hypothetical protein
MTTTTDATFLAELLPLVKSITNDTFTKASWAAGVELIALADQLDTSAVTSDFLESEAWRREAWFRADGHNWSDWHKALNENFVQLCKLLLARKVKVGA